MKKYPFFAAITRCASLFGVSSLVVLGIGQPLVSTASQPSGDYAAPGMMSHASMHHGDRGMKMHGGMMPFDESMWGEALQKKLALTEDQQKRWLKAKEASASHRQSIMLEHRQHREAMQQALKNDSFDLRAVVQEHQKKRQEHQKQMDVMMESWLNVYDSLSVDQKKILRQHLLESMEQRGERGRRVR